MKILLVILASLILCSNVSASIIADHTVYDEFDNIPEEWIIQAKNDLRITYGHTSHGSQLVTGIDLLDNTGYPYNFTAVASSCNNDVFLCDSYPTGDLGNPDRTTWEVLTRNLLDGNDYSRNVVVWSWCGQADATEAEIQIYLDLMTQLEIDYPNITFVYMTGHLVGTGEEGNLHARNEQIRNWVIGTNRILFDFADIESYDPDGNYFHDLYATDSCSYQIGNWADEWCAANPGECASCSCAHSRCLNCQMKGKAFWWLLARIAGWEGNSQSVCVDSDNDSFNFSQVGCGVVDCNDTEPSIYPGAPEVCGDGVDQDCDGGDLACSLFNTYYVSLSGDDSNDGLSGANAWQSLYKASTSIQDGDTVLLRKGDAWLVNASRRDPSWNPAGQGLVQGIGLSIQNNDVTIGSFGTGPKPVIDASAQTDISDHHIINAYSPLVLYNDFINLQVYNLSLVGPALGGAMQLWGTDVSVYDCNFSGSGWTAESLLFTNYNSQNIVVQNSYFDQISRNGDSAETTGYSKSIEIRGGQGHIIRNNTFFGYGGGGALRFSNHGSGALIEKNFVTHPDVRKSVAFAIVVRSADSGTFIIRNNILDLTESGSISDLRGLVSWGDYGDVTRKIHNNVVIGEGVGDGMHQGGTTVIAANNIFYGLAAGWNNIPDGTVLTNNLFYSCGSNYNDGVPVETGSLEEDPLFLDPSLSSPDGARVRLNSPAIDSGTDFDSDIPLDDYVGVIRPQAAFHDIGVYEYTDGSTCGDGTCDGVEDCSSCEQDCGVCPATPGDLNGDFVVNTSDLLSVTSLSDLVLVGKNFGTQY